jgi:hypothetical protein
MMLDAGAGPEIITWPMLLAGLGVGALASQLGSVTVSSVPDEQSGEVGGIQNTVTTLVASIGTALADAVLISALTSSFLAGVQNNPAIPKDLASRAQVELSGGIPFLSDKDVHAQLDNAGVAPETADAIVTENADARIAGLRSALSLLAAVALIALFFGRRIPASSPQRSGGQRGPGPLTSSPSGAGSAPRRRPPDQQQTIPVIKEGTPGSVEPRPPGPPAAPPSYPGPKSRSLRGATAIPRQRPITVNYQGQGPRR